MQQSDEGWDAGWRHLERKEIAIDLIDPDPNNPMVHDAADIAEKKAILTRFGQVQDLVVIPGKRGRFTLVAGEGRWRAMRDMEWTMVWVRIATTWTFVDQQGYMLADNAHATPDDRKLLTIYGNQLEAGMALESVGTDEQEVELLRTVLDMDGGIDGDGGRGPARPKVVKDEQQHQQVKVVLYMGQVDVMEAAIKKTGMQNRGDAVTAICAAFVERDWIPDEGGGREEEEDARAS